MPHPSRLDLVQKAICAGTMGHIEWKPSAYEVVRDDPEMEGFTPEGIRRLLREFVFAGNCLNVRHERRTEFSEENPDEPYWYRAVIPVDQFPKGLFVEVKLIDDDEKAPLGSDRERPSPALNEEVADEPARFCSQVR